MTTCEQPGHLFINDGTRPPYCAVCGEGPVPPKDQEFVDWMRALEARFGREPWKVAETEILAFRNEWWARREVKA